ncbi:MAG: cation acetate symporter [Austwickia sp.]|nr:cation acetate symporter [Actinomycetota bacterium]MCB1255003.1 cation acetate symporter [Austwickia sp.]
MNPTPSLVTIVVVCLLTLAASGFGLRWSRTTSDFYVASRAVPPSWNASAIGGEYLSAASFLGIAGLIYLEGLDTLWYPVGYTLGFVMVLIFVAAPLRRSGAYTLSDFAEARLGSPALRGLCTGLVIVTGWLYLLPQLQGAGLAIRALTGAPGWVGGVVVTLVVTANVLAGGMRSLTLVQAAHYWVKLFAIAVPAVVLVWVWARNGQPIPEIPTLGENHLGGTRPPAMSLYSAYSTLLALCLGTMGLPHVVVRFYTNPDGRMARRTTVVVIGLLGLFYLFPPIYAALGRAYLPTLPAGDSADTLVLLLPTLIAPGALGDTLTAVLSAGAFAAFLSTASGLAMAVAGVLDQDVVRPALGLSPGAGGIRSFRIATLAATGIPCLLLLGVSRLSLATTVGLVFALTASTFCPLLLLGVWWRRLTSVGAIAGMSFGAVAALAATVTTVSGVAGTGWTALLLSQPGAWTVPLSFAVTVVVSLLTPGRVPQDALRTLVRLHTPESLELSTPPRQ